MNYQRQMFLEFILNMAIILLIIGFGILLWKWIWQSLLTPRVVGWTQPMASVDTLGHAIWVEYPVYRKELK